MPKIPHFGNTQAHKTTNACPRKVTNTFLESSCHVGDHPILICLIQGSLVGIIDLKSTKYPVFRGSLYSLTTLFWKVSSIFFWGPRHELGKAVSYVKIQLTVVTVLRDLWLDATSNVLESPGKCSGTTLTGKELTHWDTKSYLRTTFWHWKLNLHAHYGSERTFKK